MLGRNSLASLRPFEGLLEAPEARGGQEAGTTGAALICSFCSEGGLEGTLSKPRQDLLKDV